MLNIIAGRAKSGKSTYIYDEISRERQKKTAQNLILIVPEQMTYRSEYEIIDRLESKGIMDVEVLSFKRLSYKVLEEVGGIKAQEINDYGKIMLLKKVFDENINELLVFKRACRQSGFLREFELLIREFKQQCISVEFLNNVLKYKIKDELLKRKLTDIIRIYESIKARTEGCFYDEEDKFDLFISSVDKSDYIRNSKIWIDGFDSFDAQHLRLINNLLRCSKGVFISLTMDTGCIKGLESISDWEPFKISHDTYKLLEKEAGGINLAALEGIGNLKHEIRAIEKNIFSVNREVYEKKTDSINIYSSMNPYSETQKTAGKIVSLIRDQGFRWKDISIAVSDMDTYGANIKKVFSQYEIPFFLDTKRDIMDNPFTKYILSILDMFLYNFKFNDVFEYLKTGFSPLNYNQVSKLENFALQYGIEGNKWFRDFKFKAKNINYYNEMRRRLSDDFNKERKEFSKLKNSADITMFLFNYIKKHKVQDKIEHQVERFKQMGLYEKSGENAQVWNNVINIFDQIILSVEDMEITTSEYRKMIEEGFKEVEIGIIPPTIDKVTITDMDKASYTKTKVLFVMGANEGKLESGKNEAGLLLDDERDLLIENGMKIMQNSSYSLYREKNTLYKVFTSESEKLYISFSLGTNEGRSLQPSLYVQRFKELFPAVSEETDFGEIDEMSLVSNASGTADMLVEKIRDYSEGLNIDDIWKDVYAWYEQKDHRVWKLIRLALSYNNNSGKINEEYIQQIFKAPITISPSKLENFAECPFKFFMENMLKPEPRLVQKVEFYDLGNIYHKAVEEFTNEISKNEIAIEDLKKEDVVIMAEKCTEKVLLEMSMELTALEANERNLYMKEKILRLVNRASLTIVEQLKRGNFRPRYTELKTGKIMKLDNGKEIYVAGRIDRLDIFEKDGTSYVNVIDYKSSQKDLDLSDTVQGLQLQLLIYMSSVLENGKKYLEYKPEPGGAYYFCIDDPIVDGDNLKTGEAEAEIFSKMSLKGYVLENRDVIRSMDRNAEEKGASDIIPVSFNKDGSAKKTSKTLLSSEYRAILNKTGQVAATIAGEILEGKIDINPYRKDSSSVSTTPCTYCGYFSVCQFDTSAGNMYRKIKKKSPDDVLSEIISEGEDSGDGMD